MKRIQPILSCLLVLTGSLSWGLAGTEEEIIRLQNDVLQVQNQIRLLQKSVDDTTAILQSLLEQLNDQMATSNVQMASVGEILQAQSIAQEVALDQVRQEVQSLSIKWDDTNTRIAALQQKLQENQLQVQSLRTVPPSAGTTIQPDQVYSSVYNDYLMGNYELAIAGFRDFLVNFSDNEYSDNASYYLGVCYHEMGSYQQAIEAFDQVINLYPKADKTPPAYYKKVAALEQLQQNAAAIETRIKLATIFPDSQEAILARHELEERGIDASELETGR